MIALLPGYASFSQNCNLAIKDGGKMTVTAYSWTDPNVYDPKFQKLKDEKKDAEILAYNESVHSGKIAPASTYPMTFTIKKAAAETGGDEYTLTTNIAGKDYSNYLLCKGDTIYTYRNKGIVEVPDGKGGSLGFTIQSPQILPVNLKVGDKLPSYEDVSFLYPTTTDKKLKMVFTKTVPETDTRYAYSVWGTLEVDGKEKVSLSTRTIHYMNAEVTGEEEVTVNGTKYKAFLIESETWTKGKMAISYESNYKDVNEYNAKNAEKGLKRFDKMMLRKGLTNELGFMVSYLKEWYVPSLGIVKSETYDNLGGIGGGMSVTSIN
jgi:hypothetical protein